MNNYEITKEKSRPEFLKYDQEEMIRRFGLEHDEEYLYLDFCGDRYRIHRAAGVVEKSAGGKKDFQAGTEPGNYEEALSIYDMLCYSKPDAALSGRWSLINSLPGVGQNNGLGDNVMIACEKEIDEHPDEFRRACVELGGKEVDMGDIGYEIPVFPFFPMRLRFYYSDEEFPASLSVLFDEKTLLFMHYETAHYVRGCLLKAVREKMKIR